METRVFFVVFLHITSGSNVKAHVLVVPDVSSLMVSIFFRSDLRTTEQKQETK